MSYQLTVLYHHPDDPAAFDAHYESCTPRSRRSPGPARLHVVPARTRSPTASPAAEYLVATPVFDDQEAFAAGMGGAEGQAAGGDIGNFATGGVTMLTGEVTSYA